jgi:hypothetical protein
MTRVNRATLSVLTGALVGVLIGSSPNAQTGSSLGAGVHRIEVLSTADRSMQPSYLVVPSSADGSGRMPLVVLLHTWGYDLEARFTWIESDVVRHVASALRAMAFQNSRSGTFMRGGIVARARAGGTLPDFEPAELWWAAEGQERWCGAILPSSGKSRILSA